MHSRRKFIKISSLTAAGVYLSGGLLESCITLPPKKLVLLHTNDMHSRIEPFPSDHSKHPNLGGMSRRASLIEKIKDQEKNVLLLDAGDVFQGTPYFNYFGGELEFKLMSAMGYNAMTLGNHDFDGGIDNILKQSEFATFDIINSNYNLQETSIANLVKPYKIIDQAGLRIGIFGLGVELDGLVPQKLYQNTKYIHPVGVAKEMVKQLQQMKCNLIICLSHLGYSYESDKISDIKLAEQVSGIDVILGGHTHTYLDAPTLITNSEGHTTVINQVGWAGTHLGQIEFTFGDNVAKKVSFVTPLEIKNQL